MTVSSAPLTDEELRVAREYGDQQNVLPHCDIILRLLSDRSALREQVKEAEALLGSLDFVPSTAIMFPIADKLAMDWFARRDTFLARQSKPADAT